MIFNEYNIVIHIISKYEGNLFAPTIPSRLKQEQFNHDVHFKEAKLQILTYYYLIILFRNNNFIICSINTTYYVKIE